MHLTKLTLGAYTSSSSKSGRAELEDVLEYMRDRQLLLFGRYSVLSQRDRRGGGQGLVQFVRDTANESLVVKFFFDRGAFAREADLYFNNTFRQMMPASREACANADGQYVAPTGFPFPPFIVIVRGEPLNEWSRRIRAQAEDDALGIGHIYNALVDVASRLQTLHEAGYVHCDLKPSNILWLNSKFAWTLIDFGSTNRAGVLHTAAVLHANLAACLHLANKDVQLNACRAAYN